MRSVFVTAKRLLDTLQEEGLSWEPYGHFNEALRDGILQRLGLDTDQPPGVEREEEYACRCDSVAGDLSHGQSLLLMTVLEMAFYAAGYPSVPEKEGVYVSVRAEPDEPRWDIITNHPEEITPQVLKEAAEKLPQIQEWLASSWTEQQEQGTAVYERFVPSLPPHCGLSGAWVVMAEEAGLEGAVSEHFEEEEQRLGINELLDEDFVSDKPLDSYLRVEGQAAKRLIERTIGAPLDYGQDLGHGRR